MAEVFLGDVPIENPAELDLLNIEPCLLSHLAKDGLLERFLVFDVAARKIDAGPILGQAVLNEEASVLAVEHDHVRQNDVLAEFHGGILPPLGKEERFRAKICDNNRAYSRERKPVRPWVEPL